MNRNSNTPDTDRGDEGTDGPPREAGRDVNPVSFNRVAWDHLVESGNEWTLPVSPEVIEAARRGEWSIVVTPTRPVPREWFGEIAGRKILCLASGGGQQAPILAAAGAEVTSYDNSAAQLKRDKEVARREGLTIHCMQGCMMNLSGLDDNAFDLVFNPCSVCFAPDVRAVWRECYRVLKPGGRLITGFSNPLRYMFDQKLADQGKLVVSNRIPYSDLADMNSQDLAEYQEQNAPMEFSHTLDDLIGGQIDAGFVLNGFFEDDWSVEHDPISAFIKGFIATIATKV